MREISASPAKTGNRYPGRDDVTVPGWFARELKLIDDRYYIVWDRDCGYYRVILDTDQLVDIGGKIVMMKFPLTRAVFDDFDERVLADMRKRKWIGRHFRSNAHYYAWLKEQRRLEKDKEHEENIDMMAEGLVKMDRMERTKTFNY